MMDQAAQIHSLPILAFEEEKGFGFRKWGLQKSTNSDLLICIFL